MITIIHGDDMVSSRKYFVEQKKVEKNPISFYGDKFSLTDLVQILEGGELFSDEKNLFIEDFFSKKKPGKEFDEIISFIEKSKEARIFFWEGKTLTKKYTSLFKISETKLFNIPKDIFAFLDSIYPNNKKSLVLFHNTLKTNEPELVFFMMIRQFRLLLAVSDLKAEKTIDEVKRLAPWQISRLKRQAGYFSSLELKNIYQTLYEIDLAQKTGTLPLSLVQSIDLLLVSL